MVGYHDKTILLVNSFEIEISLLDVSVHALNFCKENISALEMDMVLHLETTLCHFPAYLAHLPQTIRKR
jgi:methylase of polypeptide subunit release factors